MSTYERINVYDLCSYSEKANKKIILKNFYLPLCDGKTEFGSEDRINKRILTCMRKHSDDLCKVIDAEQFAVFNFCGNTILSLKEVIDYFNCISYRLDKFFITTLCDDNEDFFEDNFNTYISTFKKILEEHVGFKIKLKIVYSYKYQLKNEKPFILVEKVK